MSQRSSTELRLRVLRARTFSHSRVKKGRQSRRNRGSAADSHPADSPAMAVPETLCHPFATAKIVVWPGTCSVRGGLIIAARSRYACGDATLCAYRRRGERTGNRCDRNKSSKCLLHSRPSCVCLACGHETAAPPKTPRNSRRTSIHRRAIVSDQLSALIGAGFGLLRNFSKGYLLDDEHKPHISVMGSYV